MHLKVAFAAVGVLAVAVLLGLPAGAAAGGQLDGTWQLTKTGDRTLDGADKQLPYFTIAGRMITGFDGCNRFGGTLDDPQNIVRGQRACSGAHMKLPLDLGNPAAHLKAARIRGNRLLLPARDGLPESEFQRR